MTWARVPCHGSLPPKRYGHTAVLYGHRMIVFGGFRNDGQALSDAYEFDLLTLKWNELQFPLDTIPRRRGGHTALVHNGKMLVFGGSNKDNAVMSLDLQTYRWEILSCEGCAPQGRFYHTAAIAENSLLLLGGCVGVQEEMHAASLGQIPYLELRNDINAAPVWGAVPCKGMSVPPAVSRHSTILHTVKNGEILNEHRQAQLLITFGGKGEIDLHNGVHAFDVARQCWLTDGVSVLGEDPPHPRYRHSCVLFGHGMYVFGGKEADKYFDDLHCLRLVNVSLRSFVGAYIVQSKMDFGVQGLPEDLLQWLRHVEARCRPAAAQSRPCVR
eukprot:NODE_205_length_1199_cov_740.595652_g164_i0.p1 GENE.NODE_205_length_1199_cov_740.595652_g164_i0~~NODE_205_length_1199_cov_740.595652_g164_i0.p1  ORF type:complete len:328 (+),score=56.79 NODE_205_length_1199_cov_740.595652_g164_i0:89-1072(+)